jgi:hypothetical protein
MTSDILIKIAPIIGGALLMLISAVVILRKPEVPNLFAGILIFAALLFVIPALSIFNFKGLGIEFSGQATTDQVTQQAAGIKAQLEDVKTAIADLGKRIAPSAPAAAAPSPEYGANRNSTVIVVYATEQKALAKQMEDALLKKGYQATSIFSDFSEVSDARKGTSGQVRYVFTDPTKSVAGSVRQLLKPLTSSLSPLPDDIRSQMSADVQILLF